MNLWKRAKLNILGITVMNTKQKIVLWIGASLIAVLLVYPPYEVRFDPSFSWPPLSLGHRNIVRPAIYKLDLTILNDDIRLDYVRLLLEIILLVMIICGGLWVFKDTKDRPT